MKGSCHCGAVMLEVTLSDGLASARRCDCSYCRRRGAIVVSALLSGVTVVQGADKKKARLNCIHHLLSEIKYTEVAHVPIELPPRVHHPDYHREPIRPEMVVPEIY